VNVMCMQLVNVCIRGCMCVLHFFMECMSVILLQYLIILYALSIKSLQSSHQLLTTEGLNRTDLQALVRCRQDGLVSQLKAQLNSRIDSLIQVCPLLLHSS